MMFVTVKSYLYNVLVLILTLLVTLSAYPDDESLPLPNVIFIFADDLGWGDVGPRKNPISPVITPHIDRLAAEGMRFTDAHTASAVCAPSRYSAMTGNYPFRGRNRWGTWLYHKESQILGGQKTVAEILQDAGYRSAFFGKWHMGGDFFKKGSNDFYRGGYYNWQSVDFTRRFHNGPLDHGFDYSLTLPDGIQNPPYGYFENDKYTPIDPSQPDLVWLEDGPYTKAGFGDPNWDSRIVGWRLAQSAVDFIDLHHQQFGTQKPFFLYYASQAVHFPWTPPDEFDGEPVKGATGLIPRLDMVVELDLQVGKIIQALEDRGIDDNTLIIFTSDNGGLRSEEHLLAGLHDSVGGLNGSKGWVYEGGHRVPFFAKWGDGTRNGSMIAPGSVNNQLIAVHDWVATMYALTGQARPADQALDSANILPLLLGEKDEPVRSYLTVDASQGIGEQVKWRTIRAGDWALLLDPTDTPVELYNLATDLDQTTNLINNSSQANRIDKLLDRYLYAFNQSKRTVPDPCGVPSPSSFTGPAIDLWKDCYTDNEWHFRATGVSWQGSVVFSGVVTSENTFMNVIPYELVSHNSTYDFIDTSDPKQIEYGIKIWDERVNGFDFKVAADVSTCLTTLSQPSQTRTRLGEAQISFSVPFDLGTLSDCGLPVQSECGAPNFDPAAGPGIFLWKDCLGSQWHFRVVGADLQSRSLYSGYITANKSVNSVIPYNLVSHDVLDYTSDPGRIDFSLKVWGPRVNGFDFLYPAMADTCFDLIRTSNQQLLLGRDQVPATVPISLTTLQSCSP